MKQDKYDPNSIEPKWQKKWEEEGIYNPDLGKAKKPFYNLMMFPYPSAEGLHAGNMYAFTGADIRGRYMRMNGYDVFEPIGLDGFGIHSENYALKVGRHPKEQAKISEKNFYRQLHEIGNSYDWKRKVETYDPNYYKWTQWLFIQMFKKGLAYRSKAKVNYCPSCKTVLSDEQVIKKETDKGVLNVCERCSFAVEKKELEQWFFRITKYAEKLLSNLDSLNWSEKVKIAQKNWIGRSEGATIKFKVPHFAKASRGKQKFKVDDIEVFTTRPDTLFGATFLVVSPENPIVNEILRGVYTERIERAQDDTRREVREYVEAAKKKSQIERENQEREKTGVFTGTYAINPATGEEIPIWIADYVLMTYGTGAIMAVPAHDQRDFEFARKFGIKIKEVIIPVTASLSEAVSEKIAASASGETRNDEEYESYAGEGEIINSEDWNGWKTPESIHKVIEWLEEKNIGRKKIHYHLRDWLISRQRYWGPPIPMIYCEKCEWNPVKEEDLPVLLPDVKDWRPEGTGKSPLANHPEFYQTTCPVCGGKAQRETDVSDTFLDSSWYFFRYISTEFDDVIFDKERAKKWLPVDMYIGGAEHSVLHLLYARFITMFIKDLGLISFEEPFKRFFAHGLLIKEGAKMSKSKGNVIVPDVYIKKFGADTMRCYLMFLGPYSQGGDFYDTGIEGINRFLKRIWTLFGQIKITDKEEDSESIRAINKTIKGVTEDIEEFSYNTALAKLMEFYNYISDKESAGKDTMISFLKLLAPFAPYITEELWQRVQLSVLSYQFSDNGQSVVGQSVSDKPKTDKPNSENRKQKTDNWSIHQQSWPEYDEKFLVEDEVVIVVSVNGKVRDSIKVRSEKLEVRNEIEALAKESGKVQKYLEGKEVKKVIYVEGKIINFVTE